MSDELKEFLQAHDGLSELSIHKQRILRTLGLELANAAHGKPLHGKSTARPAASILSDIVKQIGDLLPEGPYTNNDINYLNFNATVVLAAPILSKMLTNLIETEEGAGNKEAADLHRDELKQLNKAYEILNTVIQAGEKEYQKRQENRFRTGI